MDLTDEQRKVLERLIECPHLGAARSHVLYFLSRCGG